MSRILLLYASVEGQTELIADRVAHTLREKGHSVDMLPADTDPARIDAATYEGVIVGASIHYGHHPAFLRALVRRGSELVRQGLRLLLRRRQLRKSRQRT